jgi:hypothetical protein
MHEIVWRIGIPIVEFVRRSGNDAEIPNVPPGVAAIQLQSQGIEAGDSRGGVDSQAEEGKVIRTGRTQGKL